MGPGTDEPGGADLESSLLLGRVRVHDLAEPERVQERVDGGSRKRGLAEVDAEQVAVARRDELGERARAVVVEYSGCSKETSTGSS